MIEIRNRWTNAVLYRSEEATTVREAVEAAVKAGANLAGADLAGADLAGADLAGANLAGANLARANLARADLAGANLADANLADAYLADARNVPSGTDATDPPEPYARSRTPRDYLARAERYRERNPDVPVIPQLDAKILSAVEGPSAIGTLDMR